MGMKGNDQWIHDVKGKVMDILKYRDEDRNLVLIQLGETMPDAQSHWDTLRQYLDDDYRFRSFLYDLITHFKEKKRTSNVKDGRRAGAASQAKIHFSRSEKKASTKENDFYSSTVFNVASGLARGLAIFAVGVLEAIAHSQKKVDHFHALHGYGMYGDPAIANMFNRLNPPRAFPIYIELTIHF